jgi:hypothetical protein
MKYLKDFIIELKKAFTILIYQFPISNFKRLVF